MQSVILRTLALLGESRNPPYDGAVLVLVLGLTRRHLHEGLLHGVDGSEEALDTLHLPGPVKQRSGLVRQFPNSRSRVF